MSVSSLINFTAFVPTPGPRQPGGLLGHFHNAATVTGDASGGNNVAQIQLAAPLTDGRWDFQLVSLGVTVTIVALATHARIECTLRTDPGESLPVTWDLRSALQLLDVGGTRVQADATAIAGFLQGPMGQRWQRVRSLLVQAIIPNVNTQVLDFWAILAQYQPSELT